MFRMFRTKDNKVTGLESCTPTAPLSKSITEPGPEKLTWKPILSKYTDLNS